MTPSTMKPGITSVRPSRSIVSVPPTYHRIPMNVTAVRTDVVNAAVNSTSGSVALRTSSAIRYSGLDMPLPLAMLSR